MLHEYHDFHHCLSRMSVVHAVIIDLFAVTKLMFLHTPDYAVATAKRVRALHRGPLPVSKNSHPARNPCAAVPSLNPCSTTSASGHRVDRVTAVAECNPTAMVGGKCNNYCCWIPIIVLLCVGGAMFFEYSELQKATNNFSKDTVVGRGGFGTVYKGELRHTTVAVKLLTDCLLYTSPSPRD